MGNVPAAVAKGARVMATAAGLAITGTATNIGAGTALEAAAASGDLIAVLLDTKGDTYAKATVDNEGVYRFMTLEADGQFYVTWVPEAGDAMHLPGGNQCRRSIATEDLTGTQLDIEVSGAASETATVGIARSREASRL